MEKDVLLKDFLSEADAKLAQEALENHGIKSVLQRSAIAPPIWPFFGRIGRASLFVSEDNYEKASEIIKTIKNISLHTKQSLRAKIFWRIFAIVGLSAILIWILILLGIFNF